MPSGPRRVLGVVGSPRKRGNTSILVDRVLEGAEKEGALTETIFLGEMEIAECNGCLVCWQGEECCRQDDMNAVYPRIIESDALVFGTPVYWYGPTALMKAFIDRFVYFNCPENRARIRGKSAAIAVPFEEETIETAGLLEPFFRRCCEYLELNFVGSILVPGVGEAGAVLGKPERLQEAFELGRRLGQGHGETG